MSVTEDSVLGAREELATSVDCEVDADAGVDGSEFSELNTAGTVDSAHKTVEDFSTTVGKGAGFTRKYVETGAGPE